MLHVPQKDNTMPLSKLKETVFRANMALYKSGLVLFTFGNVSGADRAAGVMVIKPSGVPYEELTPGHMVVVSLATGRKTAGRYNPSSDTATHVELYRAFPACGGVVHTHAAHCTACAQARVPVRCMGTTHADYFHGDVPVTRLLTQSETMNEYERSTGKVIVETFRKLDPAAIPAVLVANHGPFVWGSDAGDAVHNAVILEHLAKIQCLQQTLNPKALRPPAHLIDKHYNRKHGKNAYYGQTKKK